MNVTLLANTALTDKMIFENYERRVPTKLGENLRRIIMKDGGAGPSNGQVVALAAIRQCYSHKTALEVLETESEKYFGERGKEGQRLFKQIVSSGHTSTLEHISFTFAVENVSRALLAQLTRHRHISFSVQSQRYVKLSSESRSGGFDYVKPQTITEDKVTGPSADDDYYVEFKATEIFEDIMWDIQYAYDKLITAGIPQEDARAVLPNATATNLVMTLNLRTALDFYQKRKAGNGAQAEIAQLAEAIKREIVEVEGWTEQFFEVEK